MGAEGARQLELRERERLEGEGEIGGRGREPDLGMGRLIRRTRTDPSEKKPDPTRPEEHGGRVRAMISAR